MNSILDLVEPDDIGRIDIRDLLARISLTKVHSTAVERHLEALRQAGYVIVWRPGVTSFVCAKYLS